MSEKLFEFFDAHDIAYDRVDHEAVLTADDSMQAVGDMNGVPAKNLFVRNKKARRHILISFSPEKTIDLKAFKKMIDCASNLSIASDERLKKYLGIETGAVSLLAVFNDPDDIVEVYIDKDVWKADFIRSHPLENTLTVTISKHDMEKFFEITGHNYKIMEIPVK